MSSPLLLSTWSFGQRGNDRAWPGLFSGGSALDAVETACSAVESDPQVDSVGRGGLPDREGRMSLDACIMTSPAAWGSVCAVTEHLHVVSLARKVMEQKQRMMLAGSGADNFADENSFLPEDLLTEQAQNRFEQWKLDPRNIDQSQDSGLGSDEFHHDTIGVLCLDNYCRLAGACSTSGLPFKTPGRVGDSPIIGHGLYVDPEYGAAVATGDGELIMGVCGSFLAVEMLRQGHSAEEAAKEFLNRVRESYELHDRAQVAMLVLTPDGKWTGASLRPGFRIAVADSRGSRIEDPDFVMINK